MISYCTVAAANVEQTMFAQMVFVHILFILYLMKYKIITSVCVVDLVMYLPK